MFDRELVRSILLQVDEAIERIKGRTGHMDYTPESPRRFLTPQAFSICVSQGCR